MSKIEQALALMDERATASREVARKLVEQYVAALQDQDATPEYIADCAEACGFTADDMRLHLTPLAESLADGQ